MVHRSLYAIFLEIEARICRLVVRVDLLDPVLRRLDARIMLLEQRNLVQIVAPRQIAAVRRGIPMARAGVRGGNARN